MSELDEFRAIYFDECTELLQALEDEFSEIEEGDRSTERLNAVFRAIHSIKGGAGAFNFTRLVEFAHSYETLLDYVRDGKVELTDEIVVLCIRSNDLVADFVGAAQDGVDLGDDYGAEELAKFKIAYAEFAGDEVEMEEFDIEFTPVMVNLEGSDDVTEPEPVIEAAVVDVPASEEAPVVEAAEENTAEEVDSFDQAPMDGGERPWEIHFTPFTTLYERANDPMLLFRELASLGEVDIRAHLKNMPELVDFDPFGVYCTWEISLIAPSVTREQISEVFEFVDGDCEIHITRAEAGAVAAKLKEAVEPEVDVIEDLASEAEVKMDAGLVDEESEAFEEATVSAPTPEVDAPVEDVKVDDDALPSFADLAAEIEPTPAAEPEEEKPTPESVTPAAKAEPATKSPPAKSAGAQSIRVDLEKVDRVVNMVGELVITQSMITQQMDDNLKARYQELVRGVEVLEQTTRGLQDSVMAIRAQPVKSVFSRMPRLVRELANKTDKQIKLEMVGENTEIDKTIIEQLSDPLTHMIRNSADHGIENPEDRIAAGKSEFGTITLTAEQSGGNILISVEDDGAGINRPRVLALARERGVVGPDQQISDEQIDELVFAPGFSTAEALSDISGRGVGMDVVISNIKKIGGSVHVKSWPGKGTRMQLRLPLTLAVLDVMLVQVGSAPYVIPLSSIVETMQGRRAEFGRTPSGRRVLQIRGEYVQVVDLAARFDLKTEVDEKNRFVVLCECDGRTKVAVMVDGIIGQQQVVIKSLEENFERIKGIAGGTILGDGNVALIVDVQGIKNEQEPQKTAA